MLEKSQSKLLQGRFNCDDCLAAGWIDNEESKHGYGKGRTCYLYGDDMLTPVILQDGRPWNAENAEWMELTRHELFEMADEAYGEKGVAPDLPLRVLIGRMFPKVCPESLLEADVVFWNGIESAAEVYSQLPFPGSLMEQPIKVMEVMSVIRSTKNHFEIDQSRKAQERAGKKSG